MIGYPKTITAYNSKELQTKLESAFTAGYVVVGITSHGAKLVAVLIQK